MRKIKPDFNVKQIGSFRFYSGILVGLIFSFILNLFFLNIINMSDVMAAWAYGSWETSLIQKSDFYYSFFWSLFSISIGFSFTTYLWSGNPFLKTPRQTRINRIANTHAYFIFGLVLFSISRLLQLYIEFHNVEYSVKEEFGMLLFLVPLFIWLFHWTFISRIYKAIKPMGISLLLFIIYGVILAFTSGRF